MIPTPTSHPDDRTFDRVTIELQDRWKESELSGSEWRFSYVLTLWRKGKAIYTKVFSSMEDAAAYLPWALRTWAEDADIYTVESMDRLDHVTCCHPGCKNDAKWRADLVTQFTNTGQLLALSEVLPAYRLFCDRHKDRGDCGRDDANDNYNFERLE